MSQQTHAVIISNGDTDDVKWFPNETQARSAATEMISDGARHVWVFELVATYRRNPVPAIDEAKKKL